MKFSNFRIIYQHCNMLHHTWNLYWVFHLRPFVRLVWYASSVKYIIFSWLSLQRHTTHYYRQTTDDRSLAAPSMFDISRVLFWFVPSHKWWNRSYWTLFVLSPPPDIVLVSSAKLNWNSWKSYLLPPTWRTKEDWYSAAARCFSPQWRPSSPAAWRDASPCQTQDPLECLQQKLHQNIL